MKSGPGNLEVHFPSFKHGLEAMGVVFYKFCKEKWFFEAYFAVRIYKSSKLLRVAIATLLQWEGVFKNGFMLHYKIALSWSISILLVLVGLLGIPTHSSCQ